VKNGVALPRDMEVAQAKNERAVLASDAGDLVCGVAQV
jgi:xanthine dehydrogenase accessory factor